MKNFIHKTLAVSLCLAFTSLSLSLSLSHVPQVFAADSKVQEKDLSPSTNSETATPNTEVSVQSGDQKGGIYKVGRSFKTAGHGMKKGFVKTGHGFSWLGGKIKNFFTGGKQDKETAENTVTQDPKGSHLDQVGDDPQKTPTATEAQN